MEKIIIVGISCIIMTLVIWVEVYTINKCGFWNAIFLGKGAWYAAMTGMCDDKELQK